MSPLQRLERLTPGARILVGGDQFLEVSAELAAAFQPGDSLFAVGDQVLHVPSQERAVARAAVDRAVTAFAQMGRVTDEQISDFFERFAANVENDAIWQQVLQVNQTDLAAARQRGRSTTRLEATDTLRRNVISGLRGWVSQGSRRGQLLERVQHDGWHADLIGAELGVVGFVFEGRPNVVADATGVLRGGNTVVFRIGRDALATAKSLLQLALGPALLAAGLPEGAVSLVDSESHAAGWALFGDSRLSLAVARGSGPAVDTLGGLAQRAGVPVSLHGTGGAWLCAGQSAAAEEFEAAVFASLDRKVCNTLNTCCIPHAAATQLVPAFLRGLERAAERRGRNFKLHVTKRGMRFVPPELLERQVDIRRAEGDVSEPQAQPIDDGLLGREWEWEESPEVTLDVTTELAESIELFNRYSPQFVACLVSAEASEHEAFYQRVNAPFVGDGFTRWVDGQFALRKPELGLSNWQHGRLFGRGGVLSGDSVFTVRTRVRRG